MEPDELQFFGKHAVVKVQRFEDDYDSCDVFVVDENGEFYETGLVYEITEDGEMAKGDLRNCALNENYAVYIYEKIQNCIIIFPIISFHVHERKILISTNRCA